MKTPDALNLEGEVACDLSLTGAAFEAFEGPKAESEA